MSLTDPAFFKQLDRLRIRVRAARGHRPGETPIPRTSQAWGVEFESYKDYTPGDDFRYLDWNAALRLDKLMVRTPFISPSIPVPRWAHRAEIRNLGLPQILRLR